MVFAEFPGIGTATGLGVIDAGAVAETFRRTVTDRLQRLPIRALELDDAAAVLGRIPHMVNLYRHRAMFPLPDRSVVARSLTVALQLMLFPETPDEALRTIVQPATRRPVVALTDGPKVEPAATPLSPIVADILAASSALFAERGYYDVGMEDIAASAAISRATLYRYFRTKADILAALTRGAVAEIECQAAELERMPPEALSRWILEYVRFHRAYRGVIRAWFDGTVAEQLSDASVDHGIGALHHAVAGLLDSIALPAGIDREVAAAVFHAVLGRMTEPTGLDGPTSDERAAELMVTLLRHSLLREF
jgi:AcrR family transcriptional regulator